MLTILIPTFNESQNISKIVISLNNFEKLKKIDFNIFFIDDNSNDGSKEELIEITEKFNNVQFKIRKNKKRDLTKSVLYALEFIDSKYICLMDCDLQHNFELIPKMMDRIFANKIDLMIASRYVNNHNINKLNLFRLFVSKLGSFSINLLGINNVKDPLSGFFIIDFKILKSISSNIKTDGFKILLTILYLIKNKNLNIKEIGSDFYLRKKGRSKFNLIIGLKFMKQFIYLLISNKN